MTENVGDSGLRFEIWFRRRKSQDTFILQASSAEVKAVWTAIIGKILWRQALRNRGVFLCQIFNDKKQFCDACFCFSTLTTQLLGSRVAYAGDGIYGDWEQTFYGHQA